MTSVTSPPAVMQPPPSRLRAVWAVTRHEWRLFWTSPLPYLFITIFLLLAGVFAFYLGRLFDRNQADVDALLRYIPWLLTIMTPALAMRSWSEDRNLGAMELLLALPVRAFDLALGKYLGALGVLLAALAPTTTFWLTVSYLGSPDHGAIFAGYLGAVLAGAAYLALSQMVSALCVNQTSAFVLASALCFTVTVMGTPIVIDALQGWLPRSVVLFAASLSVLRHYQPMIEGLVTLKDVVFFASLVGFALAMTTFVARGYRR